MPGDARIAAVEHLFAGHAASGAQSIPSCVLDVVRKAPVDTRTALLRNILLLGGTSMLPGFAHRFVAEFERLLQQEASANDAHDNDRNHHHHLRDQAQAPPQLAPTWFPRNMLVWVGASVFAGTDQARTTAVAADEYQRLNNGKRAAAVLPDWLSIAELEL